MDRDFRMVVPSLSTQEAVTYLESLVLELIREEEDIEDIVYYSCEFGISGMVKFDRWLRHERPYTFCSSEGGEFRYCVLDKRCPVSVDRFHFVLDVLIDKIGLQNIFWTYIEEAGYVSCLDETNRIIIAEMMDTNDVINSLEDGCVKQWFNYIA
jgi:hypothetical protein